jgi:general stress protein 26
MKTEAQGSAELSQICKMIGDMSVAMLTVVGDDGALTSRPMAPLEMDAQGALWFFTDVHSAKVDHLRAVNLSFADADKSTFVSLSGRGELHTDRARIERLWTPFAKPWFPEGPQSTNLALLKFVPDMAEYWDAPNSKMVRSFAMAASVLAGKPIGLGEHDTLTQLSAPSSSAASG